MSSRGPECNIPVIDISRFLAGSPAERVEVARQVDATNRSTGFLLISGHGIARERIARLFQASRAFFESPLATRLSVAAPAGEQQGYHRLAASGLAAKQGHDLPPDIREYFMVGQLDLEQPCFQTPSARVFHRPNRWPAAFPAFRAETENYYREMERLGNALMRLFALALQVEETYFLDKIDHHFSILSSIYYPPQTSAPLPGQLRAGAHTDYGALTILAPAEASSGLQVLHSAGHWMDVPQIHDALVINIGDMLQRWTNKRWRSSMHRVVNPSVLAAGSRPRQSLAYFLHPNHDAVIETIPSCSDDETKVVEPPILAGDYMREKEQSITSGKPRATAG